MGSMVARRVAETRPERVSALVLIGAVETPVNKAVVELNSAVQALEDPVPEEFVREFQESTIETPVPAPFFERIVTESCKLPARVWRDVAAGLLTLDDSSELDRVAALTVILWGEEDAYFPREEQESLCARIPDARLVAYPEVGHAPHWERPNAVAGELDAVVSRVR
jgi:non-heme chloroperoxidase